MHKLKPITPLGAEVPRVDIIGDIEITEVVDRALASVAARNGQESALRKALLKHHDLTLPCVGQSSFANDFSAFWMGPEQWMVVAPHDSQEMLAVELKQTVGRIASVVEQTDGWCRFDLCGKTVCDMLERLCALPVRTMKTGAVTRSIVEHSGAFVWCIDQGRRFAVIAPRSSAASLHHGLRAAATSVA
ncbi:sarcosine oxidase subunit gamma [Aliiroseovarius crassostreae]|uniref:sarcosine oxidase subunit gamma n=1 Tax=Aliiroseovarius crassostreae TaxID=154981 RepID=UPI0021FDF7B9|nr:sarcosine oxidase subunit gamma [Aliiroseovarius crassostreae]UWP99750.1 sarcosine oxidase subunit gamma [Aliiroseovarius crassostreae]